MKATPLISALLSSSRADLTTRSRHLTSLAAFVPTVLLLAACTVPKRGPTTAPPTDHNVFAEVRDHTGAAVSQGALLGHWSVLWFYPKAQTSG